jgi:hypothetical protein
MSAYSWMRPNTLTYRFTLKKPGSMPCYSLSYWYVHAYSMLRRYTYRCMPGRRLSRVFESYRMGI